MTRLTCWLRHVISTSRPTQALPSRCVHSKKLRRQSNNVSRNLSSTMTCTPKKMPPSSRLMVTAHPQRCYIPGFCVVLDHTTSMTATWHSPITTADSPQPGHPAGTFERTAHTYSTDRPSAPSTREGTGRRQQQIRRLQLSDVDWYAICDISCDNLLILIPSQDMKQGD